MEMYKSSSKFAPHYEGAESNPNPFRGNLYNIANPFDLDSYGIDNVVHKIDPTSSMNKTISVPTKIPK